METQWVVNPYSKLCCIHHAICRMAKIGKFNRANRPGYFDELLPELQLNLAIAVDVSRLEDRLKLGFTVGEPQKPLPDIPASSA